MKKNNNGNNDVTTHSALVKMFTINKKCIWPKLTQPQL